MIYDVDIFNSVNKLSFGMNRQQVRDILGTYQDVRGRDMFSSCFAEYRNDLLISIEVFDNFTVNINGIIFCSSDSLRDVKQKMLKIDKDAELSKCGVVSNKYSIAAYFENGFECFLIGIEGYYSST